MMKRIWNTIKRGFGKVGNFFKEGFRIMITPFRELTWPKRIVKLLGIGLGIYLFVLLMVFLAFMAATIVLVGGFILSLGGPIENGTNEMLGRNRRY